VVKGTTEPPATAKETAMTTLTSPTHSAAPAFHVTSRGSSLRGVVVFCLSAVIAAGFVLDVAGGWSGQAPAQPRNQLVHQANDLS
jgi:hypothetical protein